jgi:hypothetical protein
MSECYVFDAPMSTPRLRHSPSRIFTDTVRAFSFRLQRSGALGEYNGKLMISKWYFGSSLAAPSGHPRQTYHDFFFRW